MTTVDLEKIWLAHRTIPSNHKTVPPPRDQPGWVEST